MLLEDFKANLEIGAISEELLIFQYEDNTFLVNQYIDEICKIKNLTKTYISSIYEPILDSSSILLNTDKVLNILVTDTFSEAAEDYFQFSNTVVICTKVDSKILSDVEDFIIKFPKLQDWQIFDYIHTLAPSVSADNINWLITATKSNINTDYKNNKGDTNGDIYRILNELDKVLIFPENMQDSILTEIRYSPESDLYNIKLFDLVDAIIKNNTFVLIPFLKHMSAINFDPIAIVTLLLNNIKNAAYVLGGRGAQAGLSDKAIFAIRNAYRGYNEEKIKKAIEFLSNIDIKLKSSEFDLSPTRKIDYIITHFAAC